MEIEVKRMKKGNNYGNQLRITGPDRYNKHKYMRTIMGDIKVNKIDEKTARNMEIHNRTSEQKLYMSITVRNRQKRERETLTAINWMTEQD
jgi:hypothetical protein